MNPSSRTPEGTPFHCPLCGNDARIELSSYPVQDATCPHCGHLIQFASAHNQPSLPQQLTHTRIRGKLLDPAPEFIEEHDHCDEPFSSFERRSWIALAVVSAIIVLGNDGLLHAAIWLLAMIIIATLIVPRLYRWGHTRVDRSDDLYFGFVFGWALVPGPPVGILFGTILPAIYDCGLSSLIGGFMGLVLGPCFAVIEGLTIVSLVDGVFWLVTGRRIGGKAT